LEVAQQELQAKQMEGELGTQTEEQAELEAAVESEGMGALFRMGKLETENTMRKVRALVSRRWLSPVFISVVLRTR
jgi:hypothetical protein